MEAAELMGGAEAGCSAGGGWTGRDVAEPGGELVTGGGCFRGRPRPGPGRRAMGFSAGSPLRGLSPTVPFGSVLCWALRRP